MMRRTLIPAFLAFLLPPSSGKIFSSSNQLGSKHYDFIIVGAGPGGSAVANRLTENPKVSVLLLEAGGANDGELTIDVPLLCTRLTPRTQWDWNYTTTIQPGLNNRSVPFPRGIGLGGSSAVNCLVYTRGTKADIDRWAALSGDKSWSWDGMLPYFKKSEKFNLPVDGHDISDQYDPAFHGFDGVIGVSVPGASRAIDDRIIQTTVELSDEFPFRLDMNSGEHLGIGWVQALIDRGVRSSSKAYLAPKFTDRPNLDVLLHAQVTKIRSTSQRAFRTVDFFDHTTGRNRTITASKEVVLSAGAVNTPQILMLSGIGDPSLLSSVGIRTLHSLPSVGKGLKDHVGVVLQYLVNSTKTFDTVLRNETLFNDLLNEWKANKTGLFVDTSENHAAWLRIPDNSTVFQQFPDPSSGPETAHYEFLFQNGLSSLTPEGNYLNFPIGMVSPASSGSVTINSSDPFSPPLVNPGLLSQGVDVQILREGIRSARRFLSAPVWSDYILTSLSTNATTDAELETFIRNNAVSFFHPIGTAAISPKDAKHGVVDPDLLVKGLVGLRIVDASVAPSLPAAHTTAPVYAIAEKGADLIKRAWKL